MKFSVDYYAKSKYLSEVDEVKYKVLNFGEKTIEEIKKIPTNYIVLEINTLVIENKELRMIKALNAEMKNITFSFSIKQAAAALFCKENNIPFMFAEEIDNFLDLNEIINQGVNQIRITGSLCFALDVVKKIVPPAIEIRTIGNTTQKTLFNENAFKTFFIRPEDISYYEDYIDTIEFYTNAPYQQDVYYRIYADNGIWYGNLSEIIYDLNNEIDNRAIVPGFAEKRMFCNRKCMNGKICNICDLITELSNDLVKNDLLFIKEKK